MISQFRATERNILNSAGFIAPYRPNSFAIALRGNVQISKVAVVSENGRPYSYAVSEKGSLPLDSGLWFENVLAALEAAEKVVVGA